METLLSAIQSPLATFGPFFVLLGLLVFVHELGHFLVAKWCGVKVETFSLGFGKKLLKYKYGDTTYCISLVPLGGYVKMYGESLYAEVSEDQKNVSFIHKPVSQRIAIVLAGPLMNLIFAVFLFWTIGLIGEERPSATVGDIATQSKAYEVGLRPGDKILRIQQKSVESWEDVQKLIQPAAGQSLEIDVARGEEAVAVNVTPTISENENIFSRETQVGQIEGLTNESMASLVGINSKNSEAYKAGLRALDLIKKVNGKEVTTLRQLESIFTNQQPPFQLTVQSMLDGKPGEERNLNLEKGGKLSDLGIEFSEQYVLQVKDPSPAQKAGILAGDKIVKIGGKEIIQWTDILNQVKSYDAQKNEGLAVEVNRMGEILTLKMVPEMTELMTMKGQEENRFTIGIISANIRVYPDTVRVKQKGFVNQLNYGFSETWKWTEFTVMSLVRLAQGSVSPKNIGGVITIGRVASHSYEAGLSVFLKTMAIISINLFLLNLLPVPVLDGGHLLFFTIEAFKGAPVSLRKMEIAQQAGLMILLMLMAFALFNDVTNLFVRRW